MQLGTFTDGCHKLPVVKMLCMLRPKAWYPWYLVHRVRVRLLPVVNRNAVHAQPLSATGCRKQMASLALYLAKRRPISFPTKDVRTRLPLHSCRLCGKSRLYARGNFATRGTAASQHYFPLCAGG
jgi:hypothetical protein